MYETLSYKKEEEREVRGEGREREGGIHSIGWI